jgi:DNA-binding transcriptional regulator GbsR (MarR family)
MAPPPQLSALEVEVIDLFVNAVKLLGIQKSVAEIYGFLFVTPAPLPLDEIVERLQISKGSASQGLKVLRKLGAVKAVYVPGERRDHFEAETELKKLVAGFFRQELAPRMESGEARLGRLRALQVATVEGPARQDFYNERLRKLANWHSKGMAFLPLLVNLMDEEDRQDG